MGKHKKERTTELVEFTKDRYLSEIAQNNIEQHRFEQLVKQGVIIKVVEK